MRSRVTSSLFFLLCDVAAAGRGGAPWRWSSPSQYIPTPPNVEEPNQRKERNIERGFRGCGSVSIPRQCGIHPRDQLGEAEGLDDKVLGAAAKPGRDILLVAAGGEHDHRDM